MFSAEWRRQIWCTSTDQFLAIKTVQWHMSVRMWSYMITTTNLLFSYLQHGLKPMEEKQLQRWHKASRCQYNTRDVLQSYMIHKTQEWDCDLHDLLKAFCEGRRSRGWRWETGRRWWWAGPSTRPQPSGGHLVSAPVQLLWKTGVTGHNSKSQVLL